MHKLSTTYRSTIAYLLSAWMIIIITSGVVFMHKEVTSTGEIVTHIHPYDFTKKGKPHHKSDAEIQYLNVVFAGTFTVPSLVVYEFDIKPILLPTFYAHLSHRLVAKATINPKLRGPPHQV